MKPINSEATKKKIASIFSSNEKEAPYNLISDFTLIIWSNWDEF